MFFVDNVPGDLHQYLSGCDSDVSRDVARVIRQHGEDADIVAAKQADVYFRAGDVTQGARWMKIFRTIAASHVWRAKANAGIAMSGSLT
jgi:hypothetical protein